MQEVKSARPRAWTALVVTAQFHRQPRQTFEIFSVHQNFATIPEAVERTQRAVNHVLQRSNVFLVPSGCKDVVRIRESIQKDHVLLKTLRIMIQGA